MGASAWSLHTSTLGQCNDLPVLTRSVGKSLGKLFPSLKVNKSFLILVQSLLLLSAGVRSPLGSASSSSQVRKHFVLNGHPHEKREDAWEQKHLRRGSLKSLDHSAE